MLIVDPKKDLRAFRVAISSPMGAKRGRGNGALIDSVLDLLDAFYGAVMQHLKAWSSATPKMRGQDIEQSDPAILSSVALSSQDGVEPVSDNASREAEATSG